MRIYLVWFSLCMLAIVAGCDSKSMQERAQVAPAVVNATFNTSDKSIESNGNIDVVFERLKRGDRFNGLVADKKTISDISQSPYSNLGKFVAVKGRIYKIEELPPNPDIPGKITEVLMLANDSNSAIGATTIDCICVGDTSHFKVKNEAFCGGYFAGTYQSQNAMGGMVEAFTIVGNIVKK